MTEFKLTDETWAALAEAGEDPKQVVDALGLTTEELDFMIENHPLSEEQQKALRVLRSEIESR